MDPRPVLFLFFLFSFRANNLSPEDILPGWNLMWMSDAVMVELLFHLWRGVFSLWFSVCASVSACLYVFIRGHIHTHRAIKSPSCWYLCWVTLTAHDSWHNWRFACLFLSACVCVRVSLRRGAVEPVVVWRRQDDNHSGRLNDPDQHCDHPSLRMEQLHLRRWPQAEVPLFPGAEEHIRLPEVNHLMNTLGTSTPMWTTDAITSSWEWAHTLMLSLKKI